MSKKEIESHKKNEPTKLQSFDNSVTDIKKIETFNYYEKEKVRSSSNTHRAQNPFLLADRNNQLFKAIYKVSKNLENTNQILKGALRVEKMPPKRPKAYTITHIQMDYLESNI